MKNKPTFDDMKQKYSAMPAGKAVYTVDGTEYTVVSHFTGNKDLDAVIRNLAEKQAYADISRLNNTQSYVIY